MFIKQHICRGMLLAYEVDKHIIPISFLNSFNNEELVSDCKKLDISNQIISENSIHKYDDYTSKPLEEINRDLAFLSLAFFTRDNLVKETETTLVLSTKKYQVDSDFNLLIENSKYTVDRPLGVVANSNLVIGDMYIQGKYIVMDVTEEVSSIEFKYNALLNLKANTYSMVNMFFKTNKSVMLMNTGEEIALVNSTTFIPLRKVVSANLLQTLEFALDSEIGLIYVLKSKVSKSKFRVNFIAGLEEEVLLLSRLFTSEEYGDFYNDLMQSGVLKLSSGETIECTKQYTCMDFLINNVRRN